MKAVVLDDPLTLDVFLQGCGDVPLMALNEGDRQAVQSGVVPFQMVAGAEEDDLGHIIALDGDADVAHDRQLGQHIDRDVCLGPAVDDDVRIEFRHPVFQFILQDRLDGAVSPIQGIDGQSREQALSHIPGVFQVLIDQGLAHRRQSAVVDNKVDFADRIAPGADAHIQVRPAAGMDGKGFHRIAYEDAVDDIVDGSLVFFMTADDFPAVVVEEYVVPYSLDAGSNAFLD